MGLSQSKERKKEEPVQAEVALPEPPPPEPPDPRLPLSAKQKFNITSSWKAINRAIEPTGVTMFVKLFEEHSELLTLFDKFRELKTRDEQAQSLELAEHATVVMNSLDEGIKAMDNVDFFFDLLHQIGASHRKVPGFKKEYFWKIENPFLDAVKTTLDERYTENIEKIYQITVKFIIETVIRGYELAEEREVNDNIKSEPSERELSTNSITLKMSPQSDNKSVNEAISNIKTSANSTYAFLTETTKNNTNTDNKENGQNGKSKDAKS